MASNCTYDQYCESAAFIRNIFPQSLDFAIILGSGLGDFAKQIIDPIVIPYDTIPHFPHPTLKTHAGMLYLGKLGDKNVLVMSGRYHYYEGFSYAEVCYPIGVMKLLGIEKLIITNAAGGINPDFHVGDFMLISDHLKFFTDSPARGTNLDELGTRFFDLSDAYSQKWRDRVKQIAKDTGISLQEGVYAYMPGPQFETPAEIRALKLLGADAVGMSTVPEVIQAVHYDIKVLGISCITNMAAGISGQPINDEEVNTEAGKVKDVFLRLLALIVEDC